MGRLGRWGAVALLAVLGLSWAAYWSARHPPIDQVMIGRRILRIELREAMVPVNGVHLHVVEAGPPKGSPVLLLHGFPEFWWGWKEQMTRLAKAGFRVIVPDQRGYNASDKPPDVADYRFSVLTADVIALEDALAIPTVALAGHDWGGAIAWRVALEHPDRVRKLVVFNAPHPLTWQEIREHPSDAQTIDWFRYFFQVPFLPDVVPRAGDWALVTGNLTGTSRPGTFDGAELLYYKSAWARDEAWMSMIRWYRAAFRYPEPVVGDGRVTVPTRVVWGMEDRFFDPVMGAMSVGHCAAGQLMAIPHAGHWLLHEEPDVTSRVMIEFFGGK